MYTLLTHENIKVDNCTFHALMNRLFYFMMASGLLCSGGMRALCDTVEKYANKKKRKLSRMQREAAGAYKYAQNKKRRIATTFAQLPVTPCEQEVYDTVQTILRNSSR